MGQFKKYDCFNVLIQVLFRQRRPAMSSQMSIHDEIKAQQQKTKDMTFKGKLSYFWDYYKIHTLAAILVTAFIVSFIHSYVTHKDYAFYAILINPMVYGDNTDTPVMWAEEFQEYAGIDPEEYQVYFDTSVMLSDDAGSQYDIANREKMMAMMQVGDISTIIADTETFESYAQFEYFYDLKSLFSEEELAPYKDLLYYTDAASFDDVETDLLQNDQGQQAVYEKDIDHTNPASMADPVAVGICIPMENNKLADAGYYDYLKENNTTFQGHPSQIVLGIPVNYQEPQYVLKLLEYLTIVPSTSY